MLLVGIVLLNLGVLTHLWMNRNPTGPPNRVPPRKNILHFLQNELSLSPTQTQQVQVLHDEQQQLLRELERQLHQHRRELFNQANEVAYDQSHVDSLVQAIGKFQAEREQSTFELIRNIRGICDTDQQAQLNSVLQEVFRRMAPPPPNRRPNHPPPPRNQSQ